MILVAIDVEFSVIEINLILLEYIEEIDEDY